MKGRDLGSSGSGRLYKLVDGSTGRRFHYTGCECAQSFVCAASKRVAERLSYALDASGRLKNLPHPDDLAKTSLLVVPCNEVFLKKNSAGTELHQGINPTSKFTGCEDLERSLLEEGFLRYEARESLGRSLDAFIAREIRGQLADFDETSPEAFLDYFTDGARGELSHGQMHKTILDAHAWRERLDQEVSRASESETEETGEPWDFSTDEDLTEAQKLVESIFEVLTVKQRNALRAVFLENPENLPRRLIARRMGIREDSLGERIAGAVKRLCLLFPHLVQKQQTKPAGPLPPDPSGEKHDGEKTRTRSKQSFKLRPGVDVKGIKRTAREWEASRMAFETSWMRMDTSRRTPKGVLGKRSGQRI